MPVSYEKLLKTLQNRGISKTKFAKDVGLAPATLAKLARNQPISMSILERMCRYLSVTPSDVISFTTAPVVSNFSKRLLEEKNASIKGGIYHEMQVLMTYNSNHIEGSKLTEDQTRYIFETRTLLPKDAEGIPVDDIVETLNHFSCIRYVLDHTFEPLDESFIKEIHRILKTGTKDAMLDWFKVGEYKTMPNVVGGQETTPPSKVPNDMKRLIDDYHRQDDITFEKIVAFHREFEQIHPFQDGNGRVGRLIALKECLSHGIVPFIIYDEIKAFYYRGLKEWPREPGYLIGTCQTGQDKIKRLLDYFNISY